MTILTPGNDWVGITGTYADGSWVFELDETANGALVLETWMIDDAPSERPAAISRRLAYLDYQGGRPQGFAGTREDRNARLFLRG